MFPNFQSFYKQKRQQFGLIQTVFALNFIADIRLEKVERESIPDEVGGGLRKLRGAVHVDPVPGTVALQNVKENA